MKDFRKFATSKMGINGMVFDDIVSMQNQYMNPYILEERQLNVTQMDVFSRLMMDRILFLGAPVTDDVANIIQAQLLFLESADPMKDIQLYINTPGGSVSAGLGIYDTMQLVNCDVATICTGMAASMGAFLLSAGTKGKRFSLPNSRIMIHQPLGGARGQATEIEIAAKHILQTKERLNRILAQNTGKPIETIAKDTDRDNWLTAEQAVEYGLVDKVMQR